MRDLEKKFNAIKEDKIKNVETMDNVEVAGKMMGVPFSYADASAFMVFFPISLKKARELVKDERLKPVGVFGDMGIVGITIFNYRDCPVGSFGEFTISIPVMVKSKINLPLLPLIFDNKFKKMGFHVLLLGVNSNIAREHIIKIFGYPTLDKNIDIILEEKDGYLSAGLQDGGNEILSFKKSIPKRFRVVKRKFNTLFEMKDDIYKVKLDTVLLMSKSSEKKDLDFKISDHEITDVLKSLNIKNKPLQSIYYRKAVEIAG